MNEVAEHKPQNILDQIEERSDEFAAGLPAHMPVERYKRVLMTAVQNNPALAKADRRTFFNSAMKCAQDGLLPDGREAALVIYRTKKKVKEGDREREYWIDAVQYIPMVGGIRKKVRNSGEIATWDVKAVYEKDEFLYEEGLDLILKHKPFIEGPAGKLKAVYSVCKLKSGEVSVDVMPVHQVERIRLMSKAAEKGPWKDHYDEMAKKTVARRHSKTLPMSSDLDDLIRRDDDLYDIKGAADSHQQAPAAARPRLSDFSSEQAEDVDPDTGEITGATTAKDGQKPAQGGQEQGGATDAPAERQKTAEQTATDAQESQFEKAREDHVEQQAAETEKAAEQPAEAEKKPDKTATPKEGEKPPAENPIDTAGKRGRNARRQGIAYRAIPPEYREPGKAELATAWQQGWREIDKQIEADRQDKQDQAG